MSNHTITRESVDHAQVGSKFRVKNDDNPNMWEKTSLEEVRRDGEVFPLATLYGWAEQDMLIHHDPSTWVPGEIYGRTPGTRWNEGDVFLVVADHENTSYVWTIRLAEGANPRIQEVRQNTNSWYRLDATPETRALYSLARVMIRTPFGDFTQRVHADSAAGLAASIGELHTVADQVENDALDEWLGQRGYPRPGLVATVSVDVKGVHTMTPNLGGGIETEPVKVPVKFSFTYRALGKGCQCKADAMDGKTMKELIDDRAPGDLTRMLVAVTCDHGDH